MRGIVVGAVVSLVLWTALTWTIVCACTWLDIGWFSASAGVLVSALTCISLAAVLAAVWLASMCADADQRNAMTFRSVRLD